MNINFLRKLIGRKPKNLTAKYTFQETFFSSRIPIFKKVLETFKDKPNVHYLEIGVFEGRSFFWRLENILTHPTPTATGVEREDLTIKKFI
ncbi:MAG: hypothetical protein NC918_03280 [Candidatus Omnitrophica bacterium]|nr:hypothetical protein [Candidatus Omnitrophota bacterium]